MSGHFDYELANRTALKPFPVIDVGISKAVRLVERMATDKADCATLLDMLGINGV
jgi:hypothetical protein